MYYPVSCLICVSSVQFVSLFLMAMTIGNDPRVGFANAAASIGLDPTSASFLRVAELVHAGLAGSGPYLECLVLAFYPTTSSSSAA